MRVPAQDLKIGDQIAWSPSLTGKATIIDIDEHLNNSVETLVRYDGQQEWLRWGLTQPVWMA